jgi:hypothetical protein
MTTCAGLLKEEIERSKKGDLKEREIHLEVLLFATI